MWKRVSNAVTSVRDESIRAAQSFPTEDLASSVSKIAAASSMEISRCSTYVKKETNKLANNLETSTRCQVCNKYISATLAVTKIKGLVRCSVCGLRCCSDCLATSTEDIPDDWWHHLAPKTDSGCGPYCLAFCRNKLEDFWLTRSCDMLRQDFADSLELFITYHKTEKISKPFATADGHYRQGQRILHLASYAADFVGYKQYVKLVTAVAQGHGVLSLLLANDFVSLLYPLLEMLEGFGVKGPEGLLRVWYYGCHCELQRKLNVEYERSGGGAATSSDLQGLEEGLLAERCPVHLLDYAGSLMGPAQWLYSAMSLPAPHTGQDWHKWYLSRLVMAQGWTLLACVVTSTAHFESKCPAFALVVRNGSAGEGAAAGAGAGAGDRGGDAGAGKKQALLVIRGSSSVVDWQINMSDALIRYTYWSGSGVAGAGPLLPVQGRVHAGMLGSARKILDLYGMRACVERLVGEGYEVKVVGHSLGAAVACLVAMELKGGHAHEFNLREEQLLQQKKQKEEQKEEQEGEEEQEQEEQEEQEKGGGGGKARSGSVPRVAAVGFGCPPCTDALLADSVLADDLFLSVVHRDDLVPRLSRYTLQKLAERVRGYSDEAARLRREDIRCGWEYAKSAGLVHDMGERESELGEKSDEDDDEAKQVGAELVTESEPEPETVTDTVTETVTVTVTETVADTEPRAPLQSESAPRALSEEQMQASELQPPREVPKKVVAMARKVGRKEEGGIKGLGLASTGQEEEGQGVEVVEVEEERVLVLPGKIIHLSYCGGSQEEGGGGYQARLCDHRLAALALLEPLQSAVRNHRMRVHIEAMRSLRLGMRHPPSSSPGSPVHFQAKPPRWQPIVDASRPGTGPDGGSWARCYVCDSDVCWPYMSRSDAARAIAVHNCRACGRVVCAVCAPAADKIPADGIGKVTTLPDHRLSLPHVGLTDRQRVCTPCFLHSYDQVLAACSTSTSSDSS